ncbi:MAG: multiprotein bridging factor aMBF1 [Candidatus Thorarchaeota archaeon]
MATCEMCGNEIFSKPINIEIEGAILAVCPSCAKHGKKVTPKTTKRPQISSRQPYQQKTSVQRKTPIRGTKSFDSGADNELVSDYYEKVRLARQKMKLSQKDVSIQTKISVQELQSIETGKMRPPDVIVKKLERFFGIKLTEELKSYSTQDQKKGTAFQTLGDVVVIKKKKDEE